MHLETSRFHSSAIIWCHLLSQTRREGALVKILARATMMINQSQPMSNKSLIVMRAHTQIVRKPCMLYLMTSCTRRVPSMKMLIQLWVLHPPIIQTLAKVPPKTSSLEHTWTVKSLQLWQFGI